MLKFFAEYELIIFDWEGTLAEFAQPIDKLFPETLLLISNLKSRDKKLAIATGKGKESLQNVLNAYDLKEDFTVIATASDFANKPDPAMLEYIIDNTCIARNKTIMVGDSLVDILAANACGIDSVLVNREAVAMQVQPTYEVNSLFPE